jgi:hypothetical protein
MEGNSLGDVGVASLEQVVKSPARKRAKVKQEDSSDDSSEAPSDKDQEEPPKDQEETPKAPCKLCQNVPCYLDDGLYDVLVAEEQSLQEADPDLTAKEICYHLYRRATNWLHGILGAGVRRKLPQCIETEIRDIAPDSNREYVGFKDINK